jgi:bifunctional non-homologous end joining protein LigD
MPAHSTQPVEHVEERVCETCKQLFTFDAQRGCWRCEGATCVRCGSMEDVCAECRERVMPAHVEPMLARTGELPRRGEWAYEFKWDGIRAIAYWNGRRIRIESRNLLDITFRYPELGDLGAFLGDSAVVDGEIVALDDSNRPSFSVLQKRMHISEEVAARQLPPMRIYYYIFDVLFADGRDLRDTPYQQRREILEGLGIRQRLCRVPLSYRGSGRNMLGIARDYGLEGIICKKIDSVYQAGWRSPDWIKVKLTKSEEFVICGFRYAETPGKHIGSLQLGAYDADMNLRFVGSVGTGFAEEDHQLLIELLEPQITNAAPFEPPARDMNFVRPIYVAEVEYRRWPKDGLLQHAAYKGLRVDKSPTDIRLGGQ